MWESQAVYSKLLMNKHDKVQMEKRERDKDRHRNTKNLHKHLNGLLFGFKVEIVLKTIKINDTKRVERMHGVQSAVPMS